MLKNKFFPLVMVWGLLTSSCSTVKSPMPTRSPSNDPKGLAFVKDKDFINSKIYDYSGILAVPPVRWIAGIVIKKKIKEFLNDLPLEKEVRDRVLEQIKSEKFMRQLVPFMLALKDMYLPDEKVKSKNFENHIKKYFPNPNSMPGLKHSLFTYEKKNKKVESKEKEEKPGGISKKFMAKVVVLLDAILFKDIKFVLGSRPLIVDERIKVIVPVVKDLLTQVLEEFEIEESYAEIVRNIIENDYRVEALSISLSELILKTIYNNYQMFAKKYHRQDQLRKWMNSQIEKKDGGELWDYLKESLYERRYAVHVIVDGLQGHLLEALLDANKSNLFIKNVFDEHKNFESYKPQNISTKLTADQQIDFLTHLNSIDEKFESPHYLPFFRELYKKNSSGIAKNGISTTPTISVRNIPMAATGAQSDGPGGTRLPNFHYVDREKDRAYYFFGNDALRFEDINDEKGMKTLFTRLPEYNKVSCSGTFPKGADITFDGLVNIAAGEISRDFGEIACLNNIEERVKVEKELRTLRKRLLDYEKRLKRWHKVSRLYRHNTRPPVDNPIPEMQAIIRNISEMENEGMPGYFQLYIPWPDHFAHFKGPFSDEIISMTGELNRLDYWLGRVSKAYKDAGISSKTIFGMAGDHGLAPVYHLLNPEVVVFEKMQEEGTKLNIRKISSDEGEGPKFNHPTRPATVKGEDVVIASTAGGNYMIDLFTDQDENWKKQPVYSEIRDLTLISGQKVDMLKEIVHRLEDTLEYAVVRESECNLHSCNVILIREENGKEVSALVKRTNDRIFYKYSSNDLLEVTKLNHYRKLDNMGVYHNLLKKCVQEAKEDEIGSWCDEEEWRTLTSYTIKPDSVGQVSHLYDSDVAGTINLFPKYGIGYNSKVPGRHAGEHFHEKDAFVGIWGDMISNKTRITSEVNASMPIVIYEYLKGQKTNKYSDGWGFDSFIEKLEIKP